MSREKRPGAVYLSASGLSRLGDCEGRFVLNRESGESEETYDGPMWLGTLIHEALEILDVEDLGAALDYIRDQARQHGGWSDEWELPEPYGNAARLVMRYHSHYGIQAVRAHEMPFDLPLIPGVRIHGFFDGVTRLPTRDGELVLERKTSKQRNILGWFERSPQPWVYMWAAREMGIPARGVLLDFIYTYQWQEERDLGESFTRQVVEYDEERMEWHLTNWKRAAKRALQLVKDPRLAFFNGGPQCDRCFVADRCKVNGIWTPV